MKIFNTLCLVVVVFTALSFNAHANKRALTDEGEVVILHADGTWEFQDGETSWVTEIPENEIHFSKPDSANFTVKSKKSNATFSFNAKQWGFKKNDNGHDSAEYTFQRKDGDLYGMAISEEVEIAVEELANIAVNNARSAAPDIKIVKKEYRMVNGKKVIYMEMVGTIQSIKFKYLGYYYSNSEGSTQYLAYTGEKLATKYKAEIEEFLNGFEATE